MSIEDRISLLIWESEAETVPTKPKPKSAPKTEPEPDKPEESVEEKPTEPPII
jgi:hypothetical protein